MIEPDRHAPTPNFSRGWPHGRPRAVIIHATRSGRAHFTDAQETSATTNWFGLRESRASTHLLITAEGEKIRFVADADRAWHAVEHSDWSWSIELTQPTIDRPYTDGHYRGLVEVCQGYVMMGAPPIHLARFANGAQGFAGHEETEQGIRDVKSDPGPAFDWPRFISMLKEEDVTAEELERLRADIARLTLENQLQQGALELQKQINELQQAWLSQHAAEHATAPELIPPLPPELAERVAELEAKVAEAAAALAG